MKYLFWLLGLLTLLAGLVALKQRMAAEAYRTGFASGAAEYRATHRVG